MQICSPVLGTRSYPTDPPAARPAPAPTRPLIAIYTFSIARWKCYGAGKINSVCPCDMWKISAFPMLPRCLYTWTAMTLFAHGAPPHTLQRWFNLREFLKNTLVSRVTHNFQHIYMENRTPLVCLTAQIWGLLRDNPKFLPSVTKVRDGIVRILSFARGCFCR